MSKLEQLTRPFQTRDLSPPRLVVRPNTEPVPDIVVICGDSGEVKTFNGSYREDITFYAEQVQIEKKTERKKETKHITNPDDPEQQLEVEVAKQITTKRGHGMSYQVTRNTFANTEK
jgi:hypothetical protein